MLNNEQQKLVEDNVHLTGSVIGWFTKKKAWFARQRKARYDDIDSAANFALVCAALKYKKANGPFQNYAVRVIRNAVVNEANSGGGAIYVPKFAYKKFAQFASNAKTTLHVNENDAHNQTKNNELDTEDVAKAVEQLPEPFRTTVKMYYFKNVKSPEIGKLTGVTGAMARVRRNKALDMLKQILQQQ